MHESGPFRHWRLPAMTLAAAVLLLSGAIVPAAADTPAPCDGAMTFTPWTSTIGQQFGSGAREYIFADGTICPDSDQTFQQFLTQNPPKAPNTIIVLNSPGGDVAAGLHMGRIIRQQKLWTQVGEQFPLMIGGNQNIAVPAVPYLPRPSAPPFIGYCYSSCTLMFLGGVYRTIDYGSNYGVHQFYFEGSGPSNPVGTSEIQSAQIVAYLAEMGISPDWITYMVKQGPTNVTNLTMKELQQLSVITPRWKSNWQIAPTSDRSGFYLDGATTDPWGTHDIAFTCAPPATVPPAPPPTPPGQPAQPPTPPSVLIVTFSVDPGVRAKAQDLMSHVQQYVIEEGDQLLPLTFLPAQDPPVVDGSGRLTVKIGLFQSTVDEFENTPYLGFAMIFDPKAKLPLRVLQFDSDLNDTLLKQFAGTCH
jgi:hypothetical protein